MLEIERMDGNGKTLVKSNTITVTVIEKQVPRCARNDKWFDQRLSALISGKIKGPPERPVIINPEITNHKFFFVHSSTRSSAFWMFSNELATLKRR
jgi:hypothetical protein